MLPSRRRRATDPTAFRYQPFYCEENAFHLCGAPGVADRPRAALFISNEARTVAMWNQRAAGRPGRAMVWDYHVVVLAQAPWEIWDLDTLLGCPVPALDYLRGSFHPGIPPEYRPRFRVVDADTLAATFASDRSHMLRPDGRYRKPPPPWPAIGTPERESNLMRFVDMADPFVGERLDLTALKARVAAG